MHGNGLPAACSDRNCRTGAVSYRPEEIGKLLHDLELRHSNILTQDIGKLAREDVTVIARFISKAARTDVSKLMQKGEVKYYIEFVKVEDGSGGDLWNFFVHTATGGRGAFLRLVKTPGRIVVERAEPELLRPKRKKRHLGGLTGRKGESGDIGRRPGRVEAGLSGNRVRLREVSRRDFERLFLSRNPLGAFRHEDFVRLGRYLAGIQNLPGGERPWIALEESPADEEARYLLRVSELKGSGLELSRTYPISHTRDKGDYRVVYSMLNGNSRPVALFRLYKDANRCAINDNIIPPGVGKALARLGL